MKARILAISCLVLLLAAAGPGAAAAAEAQELRALTATEAAEMIRAGKIKSSDLVQALLAAAAEKKDLNAFITLNDKALEQARAIDAAVAAGTAEGALAGVPLVLKDNIDTAGLRTTGGTPALDAFTPDASAAVAQRLIDAGAIILGKTNMHELAFGITSNNAYSGAVGNAYAPDRFAGGSSGGTGAAVAARLAPAGLGTDTGGSVRIPSALNGIAGLRPTVGRYPQAGIVPISHTRDTAGPMARTVADLVLLDGVITGQATELAAADPAGLRLGVASPFVDDLDAGTGKVFQAALDKLKQAGVTLLPLDLAAAIELNNKIGFPVALFEVRRDLAAYLAGHGVPTDIEALAARIASPDVRFVFDNLVLGDKAIPEPVYRAAVDDLRPQLQAVYAEAFAANHLDGIIFPTTPLPAQPIKGSDETVQLNGRAVPTFQTFIRNTDPGSNAGIPGLTVPAGMTGAGLPVGLEIDAPAHSDRRLLAIGLTMEKLFGRLPAPR